MATVTRSLLGLNHGPQTSSAVTDSIAYCFYFQIYNAKDLAEEMAKIQTVLSDDKNDWEHRVAAVSLITPPSPPSYYSSLINDRLYQSITAVALCVD